MVHSGLPYLAQVMSVAIAKAPATVVGTPKKKSGFERLTLKRARRSAAQPR